MGFIGTLGNMYNLFKLLTAAVLTRTRTCIDLLCRTLQSIVHFYSFVALILRLKVVNFLKTFMDKIYLKGLIYSAYKHLSKGLTQQTNFLLKLKKKNVKKCSSRKTVIHDNKDSRLLPVQFLYNPLLHTCYTLNMLYLKQFFNILKIIFFIIFSGYLVSFFKQ